MADAPNQVGAFSKDQPVSASVRQWSSGDTDIAVHPDQNEPGAWAVTINGRRTIQHASSRQKAIDVAITWMERQSRQLATYGEFDFR